MLTRRRFLEIGSLTFAGLGTAGLAEGQSLPGLRRRRLLLPDLPPEWDGLRVLQISDVHAGPYMGVERMRRICDLAVSTPADVVVFTGDQVDRREEDAELFARGFAGVEAPLGVYGILGNHDHFIDPERSRWALEAAGIRPLVNQGVMLERNGSRLALVGVDDLAARTGHGPDFGVLGELPIGLQGLPLPPAPGLAPGDRGRGQPDPVRPYPRRPDRPHRPKPQRRPSVDPVHRRPLPPG